MSTAIRDHFRSLPDEFVTGTLGVERAVYDKMLSCSKQFAITNKDQIEPFIASVTKLITALEKGVVFGKGKKEDSTIIVKELQSLENHQSKISTTLFQNWGNSAEKLMKFTADFAKVGLSWHEFGTNFQDQVIEPLKLLQVSV